MTEWRKRKRMAMDMIDGVLEEYPKTKKALLEDIGVETDEMVGVSLLRRFFLGHRRNMLFLFACALLAFVNPGFADRELKCLVCRSLAEELKDEIAKADPKKKIDVGTGRLSSNGDVKTNVVPYLRSTVHMLDLLENVCSVFDDYIEGTYRDTNERAVVKIMINGAMNPDFSRVEPKLKSDLNKGLKFYCETIVEEFDEAIIRIYGKVNETADEARELCTDEARFCDQDGNDVDQDSEEKDEL
ncbi:unnamed protein product [Notodromas monacha]|uniref:Saposin B-type domain-containing protein n=1 Tax=Notodromas monacha TaxID=399045 RepID=A0A7R9GIW8_9CRUS|nr:unnamed protein product [Notodromas monacha]CAG0922250.1 unnamed protein product [Notodromas monacha]